MLEKIKQASNKKLLVDSIILLVLIILIFVFFKNSITNLEKLKLEEKSDEISNYFDELLNDDKEKYLNFAVEYLYNTTDKEVYTIEEILEVINTNFDIKYEEEDIINLGITNNMLNKGLIYDISINGYKYMNDSTITDIANKKVYYFKIKKMKKVNEDKFEIVYDKYVLENPYDVLNYYNNYNIEHIDEPDKQVDVTGVTNYLKGNAKIGVFKDIIREEKKKFGKNDGSITVTYIIKNNKLLISKIK